MADQKAEPDSFGAQEEIAPLTGNLFLDNVPNAIVPPGNVALFEHSVAKKVYEERFIPAWYAAVDLVRENPEDEFISKHSSILKEPEWILDGVGYESTWRTRFSAADYIVFIDPPVEICKQQALKL